MNHSYFKPTLSLHEIKKEIINRIMRYNSVEKQYIDKVTSMISDDTVQPDWQLQYAASCLKLWYLTHPGKLLDHNQSVDWLSEPKYFKAIPDIVRKYLEHKTGRVNIHTLNGYINRAAAVAMHLGFQNAYEFLGNESKKLQNERMKSMNQDAIPETVEYNWVDFEDLETRAEEIQVPFQEIVKKGTPISSSHEMRIVIRALMALNIIEPQNRSVLANAKLVFEKPNESILHHGSINMVYIPEEGPAVLYINTDKISNVSGVDHWELSEKATRLISDSLKIWVRDYLFPSNIDGMSPMGNHNYQYNLGECFTFDNRKAGVRVIRHSKITQFYRDIASPTSRQKKWLSRRMRHTSDVAELIYRKIPIGENDIYEDPSNTDQENAQYYSGR